MKENKKRDFDAKLKTSKASLFNERGGNWVKRVTLRCNVVSGGSFDEMELWKRLMAEALCHRINWKNFSALTRQKNKTSLPSWIPNGPLSSAPCVCTQNFSFTISHSTVNISAHLISLLTSSLATCKQIYCVILLKNLNLICCPPPYAHVMRMCQRVIYECVCMCHQSRNIFRNYVWKVAREGNKKSSRNLKIFERSWSIFTHESSS